ncbi:MAG: asparagine synthase (glutamine-hydrolyzing) [Bdellovibrionota bacterium]
MEAYKVWGTSCVEEFNGMFAFAIWDSQDKELFLARDRLGKKPLYYSLQPDAGIVFASEMKSVMKHPSISGDVNYYALHQYLALSYTLSSQAFLKGIEKLPAAHWMLIRKDKPPHMEQYWDLAESFLNKTSLTYDSAVLELESLIDDATKLRLISDVPLGAFLSGGVDSSSIAASMCNARNPESNLTFSIGFNEKSFSELAEAEFCAKYLGVSHNSKLVEPEMAKLLPKILYYADEPFADTSIIPMYFLSEFTRQHVTVALSGDGADEIFAGYETYAADKLHSLLKMFPSLLVSLGSKVYDALVPRDFGKVSTDYKIRQFLKGHTFDSVKAHYSWREIFSEDERRKLLSPDYHWCLEAANPLDEFRAFDDEVADACLLDRSMYTDIKTWLVDDILVKVDRSSMAHSLEARAPFLDYRVVEFAASLPQSYKIKGLNKKRILKDSQRKRLPKQILDRKKSGFNAPIADWLENSLEAYCDDLQVSAQTQGVFNKGFVESLINDHRSKKADNSFKLFTLISFDIWQRNLKDQTQAVKEAV